jgi:hypothetical protein
MRTDIHIDDRRRQEALRERLRLLVRLGLQKRIKAWRGKLAWEDDLDAMRTDS